MRIGASRASVAGTKRASLFVVALVAALGVLGLASSRAEAQSADVIPLLDCVSYDPAREEVTAHFGYVNPNDSPVTISIGADNFFSPPPSYREQPTTFSPGVYPRVFSTTFRLEEESTITWTLQGNTASASNDPDLYCEDPTAADVGISQSASADPVRVGGDLTYTLTATNDGPGGATGVTVTDPLPGGAEFVSAADACAPNAGRDAVSCEIGALAKGASESVTIVVEPQAAGTLVNTASVTADRADPDASNNVATLRTAVDAPPDTTAPETGIASGPPNTTDDPTPPFELFSNEPGSTFECRIDSTDEADFEACETPFTTPALPDGEHTFDARAVDAAGNPDPTPVSRIFTVDAVNDAPVAHGDAYATGEDEPLAVDAPGVLADDADPNGDPLAAARVEGPAHGELELDPDGSFTYTPDPNFSGADSFTYTVSDGGLDSEVARVTITVTPADEPAPEISSVGPASGARGKTVELAVEGSGFQDGAELRLTRGSLSLEASSVGVDPAGKLVAEISIPKKKIPTGKYDVEVVNPDGQETVLARGFAVLKKAKKR